MVWSLDRIILEFVGSASARNLEFFFFGKVGDNGYTTAFGRLLDDMLFVRSSGGGTWSVPMLQRFGRAPFVPLAEVL